MRTPGTSTLARWRREERVLAERMAWARTDSLRRLAVTKERFPRGTAYSGGARERAIEHYLECRSRWMEWRLRIEAGVALRRKAA